MSIRFRVLQHNDRFYPQIKSAWYKPWKIIQTGYYTYQQAFNEARGAAYQIHRSRNAPIIYQTHIYIPPKELKQPPRKQ